MSRDRSNDTGSALSAKSVRSSPSHEYSAIHLRLIACAHSRQGSRGGYILHGRASKPDSATCADALVAALATARSQAACPL